MPTAFVSKYDALLAVPQSVKFGGATGNMNAHCVAYLSVEWRQFAIHFCRRGARWDGAGGAHDANLEL